MTVPQPEMGLVRIGRSNARPVMESQPKLGSRFRVPILEPSGNASWNLDANAHEQITVSRRCVALLFSQQVLPP